MPFDHLFGKLDKYLFTDRKEQIVYLFDVRYRSVIEVICKNTYIPFVEAAQANLNIRSLIFAV
jgi:hypothetical protein